MILKILDAETAEKSIVIFTHEKFDFLEFFLEGNVEVSEDDNFHEGTRVTVDKHNANILIGILKKWVKEKS